MMVRKFKWNTGAVINVRDIIYTLENGIMCVGDKITIEVEPDYSFTVTYITDEDNDDTNNYILGAIENETGLEGDVEEYEE